MPGPEPGIHVLLPSAARCLPAELGRCRAEIPDIAAFIRATSVRLTGRMTLSIVINWQELRTINRTELMVA